MKTEQIIEEREDSVKMKMRFKRFLSGFMAVATLASVIIQPVAVSASELEPEEMKTVKRPYRSPRHRILYI